MGGKGGSPGDMTTKAYSTSLPEWIEEPHMALTKRAELESDRNWINYPGIRQAPLTFPELASVLDKTNIWASGDPIGNYGLNMMGEASMIPQYLQSVQGGDWRDVQAPRKPDPYQVKGMDIGGGYERLIGDLLAPSLTSDGRAVDPNTGDYVPDVPVPEDGSSGRGGVKELPTTGYGSYMSPYQQAVTDIAIDRAKTEADMAEQAAASQAVGTGAFGSYRSDIESLGRESDLQSRIGEMQALGSQSAYENAQRQFEADQARRIQSQMFNEQQKLAAGNQYLATGQMADAMASNQQARAYERAREFERSGATMRDWQQVYLDNMYETFREARDYPWTQMGRYAGIMSGVPNLISSQTTTQAPSVGLPTQLLGLGIGAAGLKQAGLF